MCAFKRSVILPLSLLALALSLVILAPATAVAAPKPKTVVAAVTEQKLAAKTIGVIVGASDVNVRSGPSTRYAIITSLPRGTRVTVAGRNGPGSWLYVKFPNGRVGWVYRPYVSIPAKAPLPPCVMNCNKSTMNQHR